MTEPDGKPQPGAAAPEPTYADRVYRSVPGAISGILLLAIAGWLIIDAALHGAGKTPWIALAAAPVFAFPVFAYTLWPVVKANERRLLVRNPLRTIDAPWAAVDELKAGYSVELLSAGKKYQVWAVPVSLRQRKRASRRAAQAVSTGDPQLRAGTRTGSGRPRLDQPDPTKAWSDQVTSTLQEMADRNAGRPDAAGPARVTWTWWIIAPTLLGLIALIALIAS